MSMFRNCFTSEKPNFRYDILDENGELIAKAHLLTAGDRAYIQSKGMSITMQNGEMVPQIALEPTTTATLLRALEWWDCDKPINEANVNDLTSDMRQYLLDAINKQENHVNEMAEDAEKN